MHPEKVVLARFSVVTAMAMTIAALGFFGGGGLLLLFHERFGPGAYPHAWMVLAPIGFIGCVWCCLYVVALMYRVLFKRCEALWLEGGYVTYMNRYVMRARLIDIQEVSAGSFDGHNCIYLHMKSGEENVIPMLLISAPQDVVISRLREILG